MASENKKIFTPVREAVLKIFEGPGNEQYKAFYEEIVTRCIADVAGMLQSGDETSNTKPGAELQVIFKKLKERYPHNDEARDLILGNLHGFTKGQVHTPHPTEVFSNEAIEAEERVVAALLKVPALFHLKNGSRATKQMPQDRYNELHDALENLSTTIQQPLLKPLTIDEEMLRSIRFSQRQFDSVPDIAQVILKAVDTNSRNLDFEQLAQFNTLIEPHTWSPGDQDSKPDMTAEMLGRGATLNRRAMMFHYYRELAVLGASADTYNEVKPDAKHEIERVMYKLLKTGNETTGAQNHITGSLAEERLKGLSDKSEKTIKDAFTDRYASYADSTFFRNFKKDIPAFASEKSYSSTQEFLDDLKKLRNGDGMLDIHNEKFGNLSSVDTLIIQAMNFKDAALRVQIRQNAEMHQQVMDTLFDLDGVKNLAGIPATSVDREIFHRQDEKAVRMSKLIDSFMENPAFAESVTGAVDKKLSEIHEAISGVNREMEKLTKDSVFKTDDERKHKFNDLIDGNIGRDNYNFYQTMQSLGLAAQNPDRIPKYLIAECGSKTDLLEAFFMLKVMESLRAPEKTQKVEIVNLVEHPSLVKENEHGKIPAVEMTTGAMENKYFRAHHLGITTSNHLLEDYSREHGKQPLTVANVKRAYGYALKPGDEARKIEGVKMMMGAGSDVTKAGSTAAAAVMMDAVTKTREALLNMEHPVLLQDYIGCGGGIHRTQPVSTSFETVQGRSMRQSPENIAQKIIGLLTGHIFSKLAMNPTTEEKGIPGKSLLGRNQSKSDRQTMAQVNLGNMAGLPANEAVWEKHTKHRTYAMVDEYNKMYESDAFNSLVIKSSAKPFVDLTQYAARPAKREGTVATVKSLRAIGFGASLNGAGICAPMFFGGSKYLADEPGVSATENALNLRQMYLFDPKAQDTINRMTYGIIMSDMDTAWKYMGRDVPPSATELKEIAAGEKTEGFAHPDAATCLAKINIEYDVVAGKLLRLHQSVVGARQTDDTGKAAADKILAILPAALREQLSMSRETVRKPRQDLAQLFMDMSKEKSAPGFVDPKSINRSSTQYKELVYPAMGAIYECFEHTARAYTRPKWVKATEQQHGIAA